MIDLKDFFHNALNLKFSNSVRYKDVDYHVFFYFNYFTLTIKYTSNEVTNQLIFNQFSGNPPGTLKYYIPESKDHEFNLSLERDNVVPFELTKEYEEFRKTFI